MKDFKDDLEDVLERALNGGVTHIIAVGIDIPSSLKALELANRYDFISSSIGYHPHNADDIDSKGLEELGRLALEPKVVAWGEIGLDFFRQYSRPEKQIEVFEQQLETASHLNLPVIVHDREAHDRLFTILSKKENEGLRGVIHCFSGDYDLAMALINIGYYISIPGTVTYAKAVNVQDVASRIPIDRLLVETDAPFLAPVPKRGKRNEPLFVNHTARKIAQLRGMDFEEFCLKTSENAKRLFGIK
jgi:TatD DNase family protein